MTRVLIAEDEAVIARRVARLTTDILGSGAEVTIAGSVSEARQRFAMAPDVFILDLNIEGRDGFDLLRDPMFRRCPTIVVSAHTERALEAYELGVRDFVPKPFGRDRLQLALARALDAMPDAPQRLSIRRGSETAFVPIDDIIYVRAAGPRSELVMTGDRVVEHDRMLDRLASLLPAHFVRIHKSLIVDIRRVDRLVTREGSRYEVVLGGGVVLPVGRTRVKMARRRLAGWTAGGLAGPKR